ncbi:unnamed protein product [Schistocephalus solidus]|uniref:Secreted protein n=1 Tax=Schistocephalus solidus TaxID=70667 RepID=A0A183TLC3_SCHSO|nr:unnamed protein product [Schistocephalus solidus]
MQVLNVFLPTVVAAVCLNELEEDSDTTAFLTNGVVASEVEDAHDDKNDDDDDAGSGVGGGGSGGGEYDDDDDEDAVSFVDTEFTGNFYLQTGYADFIFRLIFVRFFSL